MSTVAVDRVPLSELLGVTERTSKTNGSALRLVDHHADQEPVLPFDAWRETTDIEKRDHPPNSDESMFWRPIVVTAIMERTAAFHALGDRYDTGVLRLDVVFLEPGAVQWKPKVAPKDIHRRWNGAAAPDPKGAAAKSDARALADQARKRVEQEREESLRRASVATVAEGKEPVPTGVISPELAATPKTCRVCRKEKPRDQFPKTGRNAGRCFSCAELVEANEEKPLPIKRSVKAKAAKKTTKARTIPAESTPAGDVVKHASAVQVFGNGAASGDVLVDQVKQLIAERNALRAQLDAIEAALVHA